MTNAAQKKEKCEKKGHVVNDIKSRGRRAGGDHSGGGKGDRKEVKKKKISKLGTRGWDKSFRGDED